MAQMSVRSTHALDEQTARRTRHLARVWDVPQAEVIRLSVAHAAAGVRSGAARSAPGQGRLLRVAPATTRLRAMAELDIACGFDDLGRVHTALAAVAAEKCRETFEATGVRLPADQGCAWRMMRPPRSSAPTRKTGPARSMGLPIVRRLGERFGWPVSIESEPGRGTTAVIRFGN